MAKGSVAASNVGTVANQIGFTWSGGRAALIIHATTFPTSCFLQLQGLDGTWVSVNGTTFSANQVTNFDLPAGQYRISMSGGTVAALYAALVSVPYTG